MVCFGNHKGDDGNEYALSGGQRAWVGVSQARAQGGKSFLSRRLNARASKPRRFGLRYHDLAMLVATECLASLGRGRRVVPRERCSRPFG